MTGAGYKTLTNNPRPELLASLRSDTALAVSRGIQIIRTFYLRALDPVSVGHERTLQTTQKTSEFHWSRYKPASKYEDIKSGLEPFALAWLLSSTNEGVRVSVPSSATREIKSISGLDGCFCPLTRTALKKRSCVRNPRVLVYTTGPGAGLSSLTTTNSRVNAGVEFVFYCRTSHSSGYWR